MCINVDQPGLIIYRTVYKLIVAGHAVFGDIERQIIGVFAHRGHDEIIQALWINLPVHWGFGQGAGQLSFCGPRSINMAFALKIVGKFKDEIDVATKHAADKLQLTKYLDRLPKVLSGGQRQRVAIGRSTARDPKVYLFDEPLSNLDAALRVATRIEIAQLKEQMPQSTMIYVTHDQVEAMTLATRIVVLAGGGIAQVGTPLELYERPNTEFVA